MRSKWETWRKVEHSATGPIIARSWVVEIDPPFRVGNGIRVRIGSRALHFGICRPNADSGPLGFVGGDRVSVSPEEIGKWVLDGLVEEEASDGGADSGTARPSS